LFRLNRMLGLTLLFILLSPGILLTLPSVGKKVFMTCKTSPKSVLVHAVVFAIVVMALKRFHFFNGLEGFQMTRDSLINTDSATLQQFATNIRKLMQEDNQKLSTTVAGLQDQIRKAQANTMNERAKFNQSLSAINQVLAERRSKPAASAPAAAPRPAAAPLSTTSTTAVPAPPPALVPATLPSINTTQPVATPQ
jgi:hypothetical protein